MSASFGFIVHPLTRFQRRVFGARAMDWGLAVGGSSPASSPVRIASNSITVAQRQLRGTLVSLPGLPVELLNDQARTVSQLVQATEVCLDHGANVIGLGGVAAMVGGQGKALAKAVEIPITSGNHLTAETALQTTLRILSNIDSAQWRVSIVGLPSPVGILLVKLLARNGVALEVVANALPAPLNRILESLKTQWQAQISIVNSVEEVSAPILLAASSTGAGIPVSTIPPRTIVIDVAAPADIIEDTQRSDVLVIDGEYLSPPNTLRGDLWQSIYKRLTHQPNVLLACFVEPMLIALSNEMELCGVGRALCTDKAQALGRLAVGHGFIVDGLYRHGRPVEPETIEECLLER